VKRLPKLISYIFLFVILLLVVAVFVLLLGRMDDVVEASGTVTPISYVDVAPAVSGIVGVVKVREGDDVRAADTLLSIKADDLEFNVERTRLALNEARTRLSEIKEEYDNLTESQSFETIAALADLSAAKKRMVFAREQYERYAALAAKDLTSPQERDRAKLDYELQQSYYQILQQRLAMLQKQYRHRLDERGTAVELAEHAYDLAQRELAKATITTPISGTVLTPNTDRMVGSKATAGQPIIRIADLSQLKFVVRVSEHDIPKVHIGQEAKVYANAFPHRQYGIVHGKVTKVFSTPEIGATGVAYPVEIELGQAGAEDADTEIKLKSGMSGKAEIVIEPNVRLLKIILDSLAK
jgi:multidrug resistance efflux pump